jgi:hypothetical protein
MATSYTSNAKLGKPAVADRNWNVALNANADALDALSPVGKLCVTSTEIPSASLKVQVAAGTYQKGDGSVGTFAGAASLALGACQTSSLYLTASGILTVSTNGYPTTSHIRLGTVVTGPSTISSISDDRVVCAMLGTGTLPSMPYLPLTGGTLSDGASISLGTLKGTQLGTSASQMLGFWGATPIVQPSAYTQVYTTSTKTLAAYTPIIESTTFLGIAGGQPGSPYAQVSDLNNLRAAYENIRALTENVAQVLNALLKDLHATGLLGG